MLALEIRMSRQSMEELVSIKEVAVNLISFGYFSDRHTAGLYIKCKHSQFIHQNAQELDILRSVVHLRPSQSFQGRFQKVYL